MTETAIPTYRTTGDEDAALTSIRMVTEYASRISANPGDTEYADGLLGHLRAVAPSTWGVEFGSDEYAANYDIILDAVMDGFEDGTFGRDALRARHAISLAWNGGSAASA